MRNKKPAQVVGACLSLLCFMSHIAVGQKGKKATIVDKNVIATLTTDDSKKIIDLMNNAELDTGVYTQLYPALETALQNKLCSYTTTDNSTADGSFLNDYFNGIKNRENYAIIVVFHPIDAKDSSDGKIYVTPDFTQLSSYTYRRGTNGTLGDYLLGKPHIVILEILFKYNDPYYTANKSNKIQSLYNAIAQITYKTSLFKQTLIDLSTVVQGLGVGLGPSATYSGTILSVSVKEVAYKKIKSPLSIMDSLNLPNTKAKISVDVHERNWATFQVGLMNTNYNLNDFSISNGNLIVKPDSAQAKSWKSNFFAAIELHFPRDVDNFQPLWKIFKDPYPYEAKKGMGFVDFLKDLTIDRIGIYGGVSISSDPLSTLHAGFTYAITRDLYFDLGWTWKNQITPQVDSIGNISSISDAENYAKRKYSSGQFALGLSFSPSAVITMLGLKSKSSN